MKKAMPYILSSVFFAALAALGVCLSRAIIFNLSAIFDRAAGLFKMDSALRTHLCGVLAQFKESCVVSPWLYVCSSGALIGLLAAFAFKKARLNRIILNIGAIVLFLLILALVILLFTYVNGVMLLDIIKVLVPIIKAL